MQKILLIALLLFSQLSLLTAQYPYAPQGTQKRVAGTVGELRGGGARYHYGLDFPLVAGTDVLAIAAGEYYNVNGLSSLAVGIYGYIHVTADPTLAAMGDGTMVAQGATIGEVGTGEDHIHLQEAEDDIYDLQLNTWEAGGTWVNPILSLNNFSDDDIGPIDDVNLFRQGTNTNITANLTLYGYIDVLFDGEDYGINGDGSINTGNNLAPLKAYFELEDEDQNTLFEHPGLDFSEIPPNASANTIFAAAATMGNFVTWITHDPFNTPYNKYWNSRQITNGEYDDIADLPTETAWESKCVKFKVIMEDTENETESFLPEAQDEYYVIDNFMPYVRIAQLYQDFEEIYTVERVGNNGTDDPDDGSVLVASNLYPALSGTTSDISLVLSMSEPMEYMDLYFGSTFLLLDPLDDDGLFWGITFETFIAENECINLEFVGEDKNGNFIFDIRALTGGNQGGISVPVPTRAMNGTWNNNPDVIGLDGMDFCFVDCQMQGFTEKSITCSELKDATYTLTHATCAGSTGSVDFAIDPADLDVAEWRDADDLLVGLSPDLNDVAPGVYCYNFELDCCVAQGCIEIEQIGLPDYQLTFSDNGVSDLYKDLSGVMSTAHPDAFPVFVNIVNTDTQEEMCFYLLDETTPSFSCAFLEVGQEYCLEFTDVNDCLYTDCFVVEGETCPGTLPITLEDIQHACPGQNNGMLNIVIGNLDCGATSIQWDNGEEGNTITNLSPGTYCVEVSAKGCIGCINVRCFEVGLLDAENIDCVDDCPPFTVSSSVTNICRQVWWEWDEIKYDAYYFRAGSVQFNMSGGTAPFDITWEDGSPHGFERPFIEAGTYYATIQDACGFEVDVSVTIGINWTTSGCNTSDVFFLSSYGNPNMDHVFAQLTQLSDGQLKETQLMEVSDDYRLVQVMIEDEKIYNYRLVLKNKNLVVGTYKFSKEGKDGGKPKNEKTVKPAAAVHVYPNPFVQHFTLHLTAEQEEAVQIRILGADGRTQWTQQWQITTGANRLDIEAGTNWPAGMYQIHISGKQTRWVQTIVKTQ